MRARFWLFVSAIAIVALAFCSQSLPSSIFAATAVATQAANADCHPADLIKVANALKSTGDNAKDLTALVALETQIGALNAACAGLAFTGTKVAKLIGPVEIPSGSYKVTVTTPGYLTIRFKVLSGDCQKDYILVVVGDGEATTGSESIFDSPGCKVILQPENSSAAWTLTLELMASQ